MGCNFPCDVFSGKEDFASHSNFVGVYIFHWGFSGCNEGGTDDTDMVMRGAFREEV